MKKYNVTFEVYYGTNHKEAHSLIIEAGNKSAAYRRGLESISKVKEYSGMYKSIINVEEVK